MTNTDLLTSDVVIVGGGLAGLFCALKLAPRPVTVISAAPLGQGASSAWAQGGIAAAVAEGDSPEAHAADTIAVGAGLVDERVALGLAREASVRIDDLLHYGVPFDRDLEGKLAVGREAAHSARRIVHVRGDMAGAAIIAALIDAVHRTPSIRVIEGFVAENLLTESGTVTGLQIRDVNDPLASPAVIASRTVVLATGGIGHLYAVTTNPAEASGLGLAIAARAGAVIADPEFVQFHPTAIMAGRDPAPLATEALRGEGAILVNKAGERFMTKLHPLAELAPRDIVARSVFAEIAAGRGAFLDARSAPGARFAEKFPTVHASCISAGIDPAHAADSDRACCTLPYGRHRRGHERPHFAERSVGRWRSVLDRRAWRQPPRLQLAAGSRGLCRADCGRHQRRRDRTDSAAACDRDRGAKRSDADAVESSLRNMMASHVGVVRDGAHLAKAIRLFADIERNTGSIALRNMATTALLVAASAWSRRESRGAHFRSDHPAEIPALARRTMTTLADARAIASSLADHAPLHVVEPETV